LSLRVEVDFSEVQGFIDKIHDGQALAFALMEPVAEILADHMREEIPQPGLGQGYATGASRDSIEAEDFGEYWIVGPSTGYTGFVEEGTAPHEIWPIDALALHWFDLAGGEHFAKHVYHPGTEPFPFIENTFASAENDVSAAIQDAFEAFFGG